MNPTVVGVIVCACAFGGTLCGIALRPMLPDHHFSDQSRDVVKLGIGLIATITALVLGLLTATSKSSFDALDAAGRNVAADILSLDRVLARYGPETAEIRKTLKLAVAQRIEMTRSRDQSRRAGLDSSDLTRGGEALVAEILALAPDTEDQRWLQSRALNFGERLLEGRWRVLSGLGVSISAPFLATLVFWLTITFACFGLLAPRNATIVAVMFVCAASVGSAVFLILELDGPFEGLIRVSTDPLTYALAHLGQ